MQERRKYYDGLRGWGALFVVFYHATQMWGASLATFHFSIAGMNFPFEFFFLDGRLAVYVFFAISGYVLSVDFFERGDRLHVIDMAVRRYPRLTIPILAYCLIIYIVGATFAPMINSAAAEHGVSLTYSLHSTPSLEHSMLFGAWGVYQIGGDRLPLAVPLWTMRAELIGSFIIFLLLVISGKSELRQVLSYMAFFVLSFFEGTHSAPGLTAMALGMALAHITTRKWYQEREGSPALRRAAFLALIAAMVVASLRDPVSDTFLPFCGIAIIYAVMTLRSLRSAMLHSISRWLGKISFPLYLAHLMALYIVIGSLAQWHDSHGALIWMMAVVVAILAAHIFIPVETFAIAASRWIARRIDGSFRLSLRRLRRQPI